MKGDEMYVCIPESETHILVIRNFASLMAYALFKELKRKKIKTLSHETIEELYNKCCKLQLDVFKERIIQDAIKICEDNLKQKIKIEGGKQ